ncbi:MAG TPA: sugar ABC transporter ATP-binding protein [Spirochaetia bacterium]|nr:sugar ABC transporter ATP-binding protein [Spirochaetia bacterium]
MRILEAKGIQKHFGGVIALSNGNLSAETGKITGLLGANGSGKSTMSKIIAGVYSADAGEVHYDGKIVKYANPHVAKQDGIAVVYQNLSLVANLTVWQNIVLGNERKKRLFLDNRQAIEHSREIVDQLLPGLEVERSVSELSPGEMQIVEIAKALSEEPKLLILDEPTAALELAQVKGLFTHMRRLAERGIAIIFTSHRLWEVLEICDDTVVFRNGANVASMDLNKDGRHPDRIISYITGEASGSTTTTKVRAERHGETVLQVDSLSHGTLLRNISFQLKKGEILGIGGLAGQGQRELMLALAGFYSDVSGEFRMAGNPLRLTNPKNAIRSSILLVPGDREAEGLFLRHSVLSNIVFPKFGLGRQPFFLPRAKYRRECEETVDTLSIKTGGLDLPIGTLSGGNQQKVVVGKWLSFDTEVLLLSDPAKGVDVGAKRDLYDYIVGQVRNNKMSVILYASDNEELVDYCDRVMIMYEGQILETLEGDNINADKIIESSMNVQTNEGQAHDDKR